MKRLIVPVLLILVASSLLAGETVIRRGAAIAEDARVIPLDQVLDNPADFTKSPVIVEGVIAKSCSRKGCWMELVPAADKPGVRVTFKDYGFFIPLDSKGMKARAEGVTVIKTLSRKEADHLVGEGAKLTRNEDGTAREVSFVASGVELRK